MLFQPEEVVWPPPPLEHLVPEESPFFGPPICARYYNNISAVLMRGVKKEVASVVCLPSFQREWALRLVGSDKDGFRLVLSEAVSQIWNAPDPNLVVVEDREAAVNAELSDGIREVWRRMLAGTRHRKHGGLGLDGVSYHFAFMSNARGWMAGKTWSPKEDSAPGRLASLSHLLRDFVCRPAEERDGMLDQIRERIGWFEAVAE